MTDQPGRDISLPENNGLMYRFRIHVIGGDTGLTEGGWFFMLAWMAGAIGVFAAGVVWDYDTTNALDFLKYTLPFATGLWLIGHGIKKVGQFGAFNAGADR